MRRIRVRSLFAVSLLLSTGACCWFRRCEPEHYPAGVAMSAAPEYLSPSVLATVISVDTSHGVLVLESVRPGAFAEAGIALPDSATRLRVIPSRVAARIASDSTVLLSGVGPTSAAATATLGSATMVITLHDLRSSRSLRDFHRNDLTEIRISGYRTSLAAPEYSLEYATILVEQPTGLLYQQAADSFPWPPPQATSRFELPRPLVLGSSPQPLATVLVRIRAALARAGVEQWSVYPVGSDGFAVVMHMEKITDEGSHLRGPDRWSVEARSPLQHFSLSAYLGALLSARRGHYRVIVLLVTDRDIGSAEASLTASSAIGLSTRGGMRLLPPLSRAATSSATTCIALIYEFVRPNEDSPATYLSSSIIDATTHLSDAGLWTIQELRNGR